MDNSNYEWKKDSRLNNISPEKLALLTEIVDKSHTLDSKEMIPFFIKSSTESAQKGMVFSDEETEVILDVLKERMTKSDLKKIDTIRKLSKMIAAKK